MGRNYLFYIAFTLTIVIAIGSLISVPNVLVSGIRISDKFVHCFAYFLLTLFWLMAYKPKGIALKFQFLILILVFVYGIIIEVLQGTLTNNRQADLWDVFANFIGIVTASIFFNLIFKKKLE